MNTVHFVRQARAFTRAGLLLLLPLACGPAALEVDAGTPTADAAFGDAGSPLDAGSPVDAGLPPRTADPFADRVVSFSPGPGAGYGQDRFPEVVLGPPRGGGAGQGSLDVLSLGREGSIVLALDDGVLVDGPGVDLLVFENAFIGFPETGFVAVSDDGVLWHEWPCEPENADAGYPQCAGVHPVFANPSQGISATDPAVAGGDGFDLAELGVTRARLVRIRDSGKNRSYAPPSAGFDLDGIAVVHAAVEDGGVP
jgi:hypothetical protein